MPEADPDPAAYLLAYEHGRAAVTEQALSLREVRDRAGTLMTTAAAVATIATGLTFRTTDLALDWWGVLGLIVGAAGFVGVLVATVAVWRPMELTVNLDAATIVGGFAEGSDTPMRLPEIHRELAIWLGNFTLDNASALAARLKWYMAGLVALAIQTGGWTTMLLNVAEQ